MSEQCPHIVGMSTCPQCDAERIAELEAENKRLNAEINTKAEYNMRYFEQLAELREAAQAVLSNSDDVPTSLVEFNKRLDALAALLEKNDAE